MRRRNDRLLSLSVVEDADERGTNGGTTPTGGLPATGSGGTNTTLMLGLGALIVGGGLFGVSQIRRRQTLQRLTPIDNTFAAGVAFGRRPFAWSLGSGPGVLVTRVLVTRVLVTRVLVTRVLVSMIRRRDTPSGGDADARPRRFPGMLETIAGIVVVAGLGIVGYAVLQDSNDEATTVPARDGGSGNGLNVSCFAYRDVDRNGLYDVGRPTVRGAAGARQRAERNHDGGLEHRQASRTSRCCSTGEAAFVDRAGTYEFEAVAPDGWILTSDPTSADGRVRRVGRLAHRRRGRIGQCVPYGVAPQLTTRGTTRPRGRRRSKAWSIESVDGAVQAEPRAIDGWTFRGDGRVRLVAGHDR